VQALAPFCCHPRGVGDTQPGCVHFKVKNLQLIVSFS